MQESADMGQRLCRGISAQAHKRPEEKVTFEKRLDTLAEMVDVLAREKTVEREEHEQKLAYMSEKIDFLIQEQTKGRAEFEQRVASMSHAIHLLVEKMEKKMAAKSAEPAAVVPIAPGPGDPSMLSNRSEQIKSQQPQLDTAPSKEGAEEQPSSLPTVDRRDSAPSASSCVQPPVCPDIIFETPKANQPPEVPAQNGLNINGTGQDINNNGLDGKQKKCTAALDCSTRSQPQEQIICPDLSASAVKIVCLPPTKAEKKNAKGTWTKHTPNVRRSDHVTPSDVLSLDPGLYPELKKSFELLHSDKEMMKTRGLELISQLANHLPGVLIRKRQEVCMVIMEQVKDQRSPVSQAAMRTLADLFTHLKNHMDPELVWFAEVLLQKSTLVDHLPRQAAILALGRMIQYCSPLRCMEALLSGLSDENERDLDRKEVVQGDSDHNVAVRERIATYLLNLVQFKGSQPFLVLEQEMLERFLSTVSRLTQDASERVRSCAKKTLAILSAQPALSQILAHLQ